MTEVLQTTITKNGVWTPPVQGHWTYDDYQQLPNDGRRYEIINGVLFVANAPNLDHQFAVMEIAAELRNYAKAHGLGRVYVAPCEVHLSERSKPVQPDIFFVRQERAPERRAPFFDGAPDLIVEVISPSSIRLDRVTKFTEYEQTGVHEYWIVDPVAHLVEVYTLARGEYALLGTFQHQDTIQSQIFAGIEITINTIFA